MPTFKVQDMSCNHCASAITKAIKTIAPDASVNIDLANKKVSVDAQVDAKALEAAIADAGFTPVQQNG